MIAGAEPGSADTLYFGGGTPSLLAAERLARIVHAARERFSLPLGAEITVEAGTRLIDIYRATHHRLLALAASPTESHSSVAGAICANVNGKDAWRNDSFAHQIVRLTLMLANGEMLDVDRSHELFNAVVGGIGLLGLIVDATLALKPIPSPFVEINRIPTQDVDALLATMALFFKDTPVQVLHTFLRML